MKKSKRIALALMPTAALCALGAYAIIQDSRMLRKLPPEERAAVISYRENSVAIANVEDTVTFAIYNADQKFGEHNYAAARKELSSARDTLNYGMTKLCPSKNTNAGKECLNELLRSAKRLDNFSDDIESWIKTSK